MNKDTKYDYIGKIKAVKPKTYVPHKPLCDIIIRWFYKFAPGD